MPNVKTLRTVRFTIYYVNNRVTLAKSNATGRFVKRAIAQADLDAHFASCAVDTSNTLACAAVACAFVAAVFVALALWAHGDIQLVSALLAVVATAGAVAFKSVERAVLSQYWALSPTGTHYVRVIR